MTWIPYVLMTGRAKENFPGGSLKYLFVYVVTVYQRIVRHSIMCVYI